MLRDFYFWTDCVHSVSSLIQEMVDDAQPVTWRTMRAHCADIDEVATQLGYGRDIGLFLGTDWHVGFYKGYYAGVPCYFFTWSAIEHIFIQQRNTKSVQRVEEELR